jgi:pimeloyl-ACP methyl ester carboxylesterase
VNGVGIEFEVTGEGRPVVLLHGFPDSGRLWRHQVPALADAGFQVIVPDLRGYGGSDQPEEVEAYSIPFLAGDVLGILDQLGVDKAHVVGHDWGAALAWVMGSLVPDRVDHLVALSVGHPLSFRAAGLEQQEKSWYMLLFQFEGVAEQWLQRRLGQLPVVGRPPRRRWCHRRPGADGSLTPALKWYRANVPPEALIGPPWSSRPSRRPTMGVWGSGDFALTEAPDDGIGRLGVGSLALRAGRGVAHWMQLEAPEKVNELLLDFLPRYS